MNTRSFFFSLAGTIFLAAAVCSTGLSNSTDDNEPNGSATSKNRLRISTDEEIEKKLQQPAAMDYDEVEFVEVMNELRDHNGINVVLDQSAQDDSLTEDELITIHVSNINLSTALHLMLNEKNATYLVSDGVLKIISLDVASDPEFFQTKIINCRDLLAKIAQADPRVGQPVSIQRFTHGGGFGSGGAPNSKGGGVFNLMPQAGGGGGGFGGGGGGGFGGGGGRPISISPEHLMLTQGMATEFANQDADKDGNQVTANKPTAQGPIVTLMTAERLLLELIRVTVDPDGWDDTSGDGTIVIMGGLMVISQSQKTIEDVEKLLAELNQKMG